MNTVTAMLLMIVNSSFYKDTDYDIALKLLTSFHHIEDLTLTNLTADCQTSGNYVNKFCKMLGFKSFADLKYNLKNAYHIRRIQMTNHLEKTNEKQILDNIVYLSHNTFDIEMFKMQIKQLIKLIDKAEKIDIIGAYYPTSLAVHFQEDMLIMGKLIRICPQKNHLEIEDGKKDLAIIITLTGRLYEYNTTTFEKFCQSYQHIALMCGFDNYPKIENIQPFIKMPINDDDEISNLILVEVLRYIKLMYHEHLKER